MLSYKSGDIKKFYDGVNLFSCISRSSEFTFSRNTTYRLGGGVISAFYPKNIPEALAAYDYFRESGSKYEVLGNGSNVLASDNFYNGYVLSTKKLKGIINFGENTLFCLAGTGVNTLMKYCAERGFGGLEYLYGIPASVGGLVYMNGGIGDKTISSDVLSVKVYNGRIHNLSNKKCAFGNKHSIMRDINCLILGVFLSVFTDSRKNIAERLALYKSKRSHLPKGKSCGCVFKNNAAMPAGKLIDLAGLKGTRIGGAYVSEEHANFIINDGASAEEVKELIAYVKNSVKQKFGITLVEEVVYMGDFVGGKV